MPDEQQRIADLEAANEALLEQHARISIGYLSLRIAKIEDEMREEMRRLRDENDRLRIRIDAAGKFSRDLKAEVGRLRNEQAKREADMSSVPKQEGTT